MASDSVPARRQNRLQLPDQRLMLNAFRPADLRIQTKEIRLGHLDAVEKKEIEIYSRFHKLWNIEFNDHYQPSNRRY